MVTLVAWFESIFLSIYTYFETFLHIHFIKKISSTLTIGRWLMLKFWKVLASPWPFGYSYYPPHPIPTSTPLSIPIAYWSSEFPFLMLVSSFCNHCRASGSSPSVPRDITHWVPGRVPLGLTPRLPKRAHRGAKTVLHLIPFIWRLVPYMISF